MALLVKALDRAIEAVAPTWGLRRANARARLAYATRIAERTRGFEGADRGRRTQGWISTGGGANAELRTGLDVLRARARALRRDNSHARSAIGVLRGHLAGRGIRPKFMHDRDAVLRDVGELWEEWSSQPICDVAGRLSWHAMQGACAESMVEGGEALVRRRRRRAEDGLTVPLQLQLLEADHIDDARDILAPARARRGQNVIVQGCEFDRFGRPLGTYLFDEHPGEGFYGGSTESRFVRAEDLRRIYRLDRLGQVRGIPWLAPVILRLHDYDGYEDNEALRMIAATSYAGFVRDLTADASFEDGVGPLGTPTQRNQLGQPIDEIPSGTIEFLPLGKTIEFNSPPQNEGFPEYSKVQLRSIAAGAGVPYWLMTHDLAEVNFSTARASLIGWRTQLEQWRDDTLVLHFCEPTLRWWMDQAELARVLRTDGLQWAWMAPRREMIDPRTEVNAEIAQVRAGFKSLSAAIEGLGMDSRKVLDQLAADFARVDQLGLVLSVDGRQAAGPQNGNVNGNGGGGSRAASAGRYAKLADRLVELLERGDDEGQAPGDLAHELGLEIDGSLANGRG